jgi:chemotaxis protein histidine kinase CheA
VGPAGTDLSDLLPLFVEEARDRLSRIARLLPRLPGDPGARTLVQRELHTLQGASRMLSLREIAVLVQDAQELLAGSRPEDLRRLAQAADQLTARVEAL